MNQAGPTVPSRPQRGHLQRRITPCPASVGGGVADPARMNIAPPRGIYHAGPQVPSRPQRGRLQRRTSSLGGGRRSVGAGDAGRTHTNQRLQRPRTPTFPFCRAKRGPGSTDLPLAGMPRSFPLAERNEVWGRRRLVGWIAPSLSIANTKPGAPRPRFAASRLRVNIDRRGGTEGPVAASAMPPTSEQAAQLRRYRVGQGCDQRFSLETVASH